MFCGYNKKMSNGVKQFLEGLTESIHKNNGGVNMPLCGYNKKMSNGVKLFLDGLTESINRENGGVKMAFCGYNEKISNGIKTLLEGLVEYGILERSKLKNRTVSESLSVELSDLTRLLSESSGLEDAVKRDITEGVAKLARGFYSIINTKNIGDYKKIIGIVDSYFWQMDKKYYPELEKKKESGDSTDMKQLVKYLNTIKIKK